MNLEYLKGSSFTTSGALIDEGKSEKEPDRSTQQHLNEYVSPTDAC